MIFKNPPKLPSLTWLNKYVQSDLFNFLSDVSRGLNGNLNFDDNCPSFLAQDVTIEAGDTAEIPNALSVIPNERTIVRQIGDGVITDGTWDINTVRLVNNGAVTVVISVRFFHFYRRG